MEKRLLWASLILSFVIHAAGIGLLSLSSAKKKGPGKPFKSIEVTYQDIKHLDKPGQKTAVRDLKIVQDRTSQQKEKVKVLTRKDDVFSSFTRKISDISKFSGKLLTSQQEVQKISTLDIGNKITLPPLSSEKITNAQYLTYNDDMRAAISLNIKQRAYTYVNHPEFEAGEVYVTFVLAKSGDLKKIKIIDEKTSANSYLRNVALRSIMESSPFSPFPRGFDYPEFTFNVLISFQN